MISNNLKKLSIELPNPPDPVGAYTAYKIIGNLLFISGQLPIDLDGKIIKGKIGKDLTLEDGQRASKLCVLNILAQAKKAMNGDLNKIKNCIKITGFVNSVDDFIDQPKVINPASEILSAVMNEKGKLVHKNTWSDSIYVQSYIETVRKTEAVTLFTEKIIPVNKYVVMATVFDIESRKFHKVSQDLELETSRISYINKPILLIEKPGNWGFSPGLIPTKSNSISSCP